MPNQILESTTTTVAWYAPGPLQVKIGGGDFTSWKNHSDLTQAMKQRFRWRPTTTNPLKAVWQLSSIAFPPEQSGIGQRGLIASGVAEVPAAGKWEHFEVDLSQYLPAQAPDEAQTYYVRVVALHDRKPFKALTGNVVLTYKKYEPTVVFHFPTIKEAHPGLYNSSPMTVEVDLNELYISHENEGGDEPYLLLAIAYVDGTTINPLDFGSSTVRLRTPAKVHGNVFDVDQHGDDLDTYKTAKIPNATARFVESIVPIGLDLAADLEESAHPTLGDSMGESTKVFILAAAFEEDATSDSAAEAARDTAISTLQGKLNGIVQSMTLANLQAGEQPVFDPEAITEEIRAKAMDAAMDETLSGAWFLGPFLPALLDDVLDRDDFVGSGRKEFSYQQILSAGSGGITFEIPLVNSDDWEGSYKLRGRIRKL